MKQFISFVHKEFIHILRDPKSLIILLALPQMMIILLGFVVKTDVRDVRVAILDQSRDVYTTRISQRFGDNEYFSLQGYVDSDDDVDELFRKGKIDIAIVFSPEFADRLQHSGDAAIQIIADGTEPNQASARVAYAQQIIASLRSDLNVGATMPMNIVVNTQMLYNPQQRSEVNFVPGVIGLVMLLICCMMTSIAIVRERESGTMEVLLASPLPTFVIVISKLIPYMIISIFNLACILMVTTFLMDVPVVGSLAVYWLLSLVYITVSLLLGLLISTLVNSQLVAMLISLLLIVPSLYLSGMIFTIESMPMPAQVISNIIPTKWFIAASRKVMIQGVELQYITKELLILCLQGLIFLLLSWKFFKTRLE